MTEKQSTSNKGGARPGAGRKKGVPNKITTEIKTAILAAFDKAGGQDYLARQAEENPVAFMTLLGKILPAEIKAELTGENGGPMELITRIELVPLDNSTDSITS